MCNIIRAGERTVVSLSVWLWLLAWLLKPKQYISGHNKSVNACGDLLQMDRYKSVACDDTTHHAESWERERLENVKDKPYSKLIFFLGYLLKRIFHLISAAVKSSAGAKWRRQQQHEKQRSCRHQQPFSFLLFFFFLLHSWHVCVRLRDCFSYCKRHTVRRQDGR